MDKIDVQLLTYHRNSVVAVIDYVYFKITVIFGISSLCRPIKSIVFHIVVELGYFLVFEKVKRLVMYFMPLRCFLIVDRFITFSRKNLKEIVFT